MMSYIFLFFVLFFSNLIFTVSSPMKMSFVLLILSLFCFSLLNELMGVSWFSFIFLLLFIGGILMMFMIISSVLPNEKPKKVLVPFIMLLCFIFVVPEFFFNSLEFVFILKTFIYSSFNFYFLTSVILFYFLSFVFFVTTQHNSLRSLGCF